MEDLRCTLVVVAIAILCGVCDLACGYPNGAPAKACVTMVPGHYGTSPQTSPPPFQVTALSNSYRPNQNVTVLLSAPCSAAQFQGFLLQARRADVNQDRNETVGTFNTPPQSKHVSQCGATGREAVTHTDSQPKSMMTFQWTAPAQFVGHIVFAATLLTEKSTYWVKVYSSVVREEGQNLGPDAGTEVYPTPSTCSVQPTQPPPPSLPEDTACGLWKSCMSDCTNMQCSYIVSWRNSTTDDNAVIFELSSVVDRNTNRWMAIGFSEDREMGEDEVVECVAFNNAINVYSSYNTITPRLDNVRNENPTPADGVFKEKASVVDGVFRCTVRVVTDQFSYIDLTIPRYLLFAAGRTASFRDTKLQHNIDGSFPPVSVEKIEFMGEVNDPMKKNDTITPSVATTLSKDCVYIQMVTFVVVAFLTSTYQVFTL